MEYEDFIERIENHPAFKRLENISQYGILSFIFPDIPEVKRTRKEHSIEVCEITQKILEVLKENGYCDDPTKEKSGIAAALLHDIGHRPFSHTSEGVLPYNGNKDHKNQGVEIIETQEDEEGKTIQDILREYEINPDIVKNIILKKDKDNLWKLVGSILGGDKFQYVPDSGKMLKEAGFKVTVFEKKNIDEIIKGLCFTKEGFYGIRNEFFGELKDKLSEYLEAYTSIYHKGFLQPTLRIVERAFQKTLYENYTPDFLFLTENEIWDRLNEKFSIEERLKEMKEMLSNDEISYIHIPYKTLCSELEKQNICSDLLKNIDPSDLYFLERKIQETYKEECFISIVPRREPGAIEIIYSEPPYIELWYNEKIQEMIEKSSGILICLLTEKDYEIKDLEKKFYNALIDLPKTREYRLETRFPNISEQLMSISSGI